MRKTLSLVVLLAATSTYADDHSTRAKQTSGQNAPPSPVATVPAKEVGSPAQPAVSEQHIQADVKIISTPEKDLYDKWAFWITAALAGAGIAGVLIGLRTLSKISIQTSAIQKSTEIQEAQLIQWLAIENWRALPHRFNDGAWSLHIEFEIINPTKLPLTLASIHVQIDRQGLDSVHENTLPPDHRFTGSTDIKINDKQLARTQEGTLVLPIRLLVEYQDARKIMCPYVKNGFLAVTKSDVTFHTFHGPGIYMKGEKKNGSEAD